MPLRLLLPLLTLAFLWCSLPPVARADADRANVAYTGVYLMGNGKTKGSFPIYLRNQEALRDALRVEMKRLDEQGVLPFRLLFDTDMEEVKLRIDNTLSLAFVVVRDDVATESFKTAGVAINKTIVNVGLTAILYDTRKVDGRDRNTVVFSFPLVGYSQRLDGERSCSEAEIDSLFVAGAVSSLRENIAGRLAGVTLAEVFGTVLESSAGAATVSVGSGNGLEEGQRVYFLAAGKRLGSGTIIKLGREGAVVEVPKALAPQRGMQVRATNIRASSDETFQVVEAKVSSRKAAKLFPQEVIGPQAAQWFSSFLTDRGGKVVLPSRVGGEWDQRATGTAFSLVDRGGVEHRFELPPPKYAVSLDLTGVSSKVTESNEVNDLCMFKVWLKVSVPAKKYEKEFEAFSSKCLVKGVQSFEEKNELFDLLYQLTAKAAREAEI